MRRPWAWLMHRGPARRPAPRVLWVTWLAILIANDIWAPKWGWWLFLHPGVAAGIRIGLMVAVAVAAAGTGFMGAVLLLKRRKKRDRR